ncbi:MAG: glycosyltransferase [Candidatus Omnitrophota bacterium]|nr:MAG: glycosyltransferase [Candidatus Omnitrophota bacterium]
MPDKKPLFSIAATTYNHGDYIKATLKSVLEQTIQDFELILVDDGSTDNTKEEVLSIKDERIKYFYQAPTGLPACARNRSIERTCGRYIALLDGDDIWSQEKLERSLGVFKENPETDILCHDVNVTNEKANSKRRVRFGPYPKDLYSKLLWEGYCFGISMSVLKKEVFFKYNFWFDEDKRLFAVEDYEFFLRLAKSQKFNFYYLPEALAEHVVSEKGAILNNVDRNAKNLLYLFDTHIKKHNYDTPDKKERIAKRRSSLIRSIALLYNYRRNYSKSRLWFIKAIKEYPFNINNYLGAILSSLKIRVGTI